MTTTNKTLAFILTEDSILVCNPDFTAQVNTDRYYPDEFFAEDALNILDEIAIGVDDDADDLIAEYEETNGVELISYDNLRMEEEEADRAAYAMAYDRW